MNRTVLFDQHRALGARLVPFAGYEMPVQYSSPLAEHHTVRQAAGLFDIDHMGQFIVSGAGAEGFLNLVSTSAISALAVWEAQYGLLCYHDGGTVDDIFIYRRPDDYFVVVNAANRAKDLEWLRAHQGSLPVTIDDVSDETCMLAFQGPQAQAILQTLCPDDLSSLAFHFSRWTQVAGADVFLGATGYTGEYGYELFFPAAEAARVWSALLEAGEPHGVLPIGLAARDSLRFEACLPLYGHELGPDISPLEAGLGFAVSFAKPDFIGRAPLLKQKLEGPPRRLACLRMAEKAVPREGYEVRLEEATGVVSTGMYAPTLDAYAAMALVPRAAYRPGGAVEVMVRGTPRQATIVKRPFYTPAYRR